MPGDIVTAPPPLGRARARTQRPVGFAQRLPPDQDGVGVAFVDDLFGVARRGDQTDRAGRDPGFPADAGGEGHLIARLQWNLLLQCQAAGRAIDEVYALSLEPVRQHDALFDIPRRSGQPIGRVDADEQGQPLGPDRAHRARDLQQQACAVLEAAAIVVGAPVADGREKFVQQVAVCGVNLDRPETRGRGPLRRFPEALNDGVQILAVIAHGRSVCGENTSALGAIASASSALRPACAN